MAVAPDMSGLHRLSEVPAPTLQEAVPILARLVEERSFFDAYIRPLVEQAEQVEGWHLAHCYDVKGGSCSLQIFVWSPGSRTRVHDHSCWGAFCCVVGSLSEERYERLDSGLRPGHPV